MPMEINWPAKLWPKKPPRMYPSPRTMPPSKAMGRGPILACILPASTMTMAKVASPAEKIHAACDAVNP